jgi:GlpG protein
MVIDIPVLKQVLSGAEKSRRRSTLRAATSTLRASGMRQLHTFEREESARTLGDTLYAEGIEATVKASREGGYALWVHDDDDLDAARAILAAYEADPKDPRFASRAREAKAQRRAEEREEKKLRQRTERAARAMEASQGTGAVTKFLLFGCIGFAIMASLVDPDGAGGAVFQQLTFRDPSSGSAPFAAIARGEVWRLFTPIFIYPGLPRPLAAVNLLVDMWWLKTLASRIEQVHRGRFLAALVLATALVTCVAQVGFGVGVFGGMSGVIAALFAYVYVRGRVDPANPVGLLAPSLTFWMLVWAVLVMADTNVVPLVVSGFAFGGLLGYAHGRLGRR